MDNILIIGGPNAGKTHFGGQLYGRLNSRLFKYKISSSNRPADLTIFNDVLNKLYEGKRAAHTEGSANNSIELKIESESESDITFSFPDYAGEQVNLIIDNRRVNTIWKEYIDESSSWILFVRLDDIDKIEDIINRGIPSPEELKKRNNKSPPVRLSDAAQFVELLQTLLYIKKISSLSKISRPNLTIVLSCWDVLKQKEGAIPLELLKDRLPLLYDFVSNNWEESSLSILGFSSTEKTLTDDPDEEYIESSPIEFGYFITHDGVKEKDLTLAIGTFIGR